MKDKLPVSEAFYSIQGEGITMGVPAVFLRLGGCNLMCGGNGTQHDKKLHHGATWRCDTIEVWMKSKAKKFNEVLSSDQLKALQLGAHLIITGGEPLLHQEAIIEYLQYLIPKVGNLYTEVETNGTITPTVELTKLVSQWNVSPKLTNSGNTYEQMRNIGALQSFNLLNTQYKFVISDKADWDEIQLMYQPYIDTDKLILMPAGEDIDLLNENKELVAELCKQYAIRFTTRLHIEIWNKKTGV